MMRHLKAEMLKLKGSHCLYVTQLFILNLMIDGSRPTGSVVDRVLVCGCGVGQEQVKEHVQIEVVAVVIGWRHDHVTLWVFSYVQADHLSFFPLLFLCVFARLGRAGLTSRD